MTHPTTPPAAPASDAVSVLERVERALENCHLCLTGEYDTDSAHQHAIQLADAALSDLRTLRQQMQAAQAGDAGAAGEGQQAVAHVAGFSASTQQPILEWYPGRKVQKGDELYASPAAAPSAQPARTALEQARYEIDLGNPTKAMLLINTALASLGSSSSAKEGKK